MSLHLSSHSGPETPSLKRLPDSMLTSIREYAAAEKAKKTSEADARAADNVLKSLRSSILAAMGDSRTAVCGHVTLAVKEPNDVPAALTMKTGAKLPWASVTSILVGNVMHDAKDVTTLYGGRVGNIGLVINGA